MSQLSEIRDGWNKAAQDDAMFHILTHADKIGNQWDPDEFFATGRAEIDAAVERLEELRPDRGRGAALDFGCGVGRLTQALTYHYEGALGLDISPAMIDLARDYAGKARCRFFTLRGSSLRPLGNARFDLVYSMITLQHLPVELQEGYVKDFVRVLAPRGLAMFQTPEGNGQIIDNGHLSMYGVRPSVVEHWVGTQGGSVIARDACDQGDFPGWRYVVSR